MHTYTTHSDTPHAHTHTHTHTHRHIAGIGAKFCICAVKKNKDGSKMVTKALSDWCVVGLNNAVELDIMDDDEN